MHIATFSEEVIRQSFEVFDKQINLMFDGALNKGTLMSIIVDKLLHYFDDYMPICSVTSVQVETLIMMPHYNIAIQ